MLAASHATAARPTFSFADTPAIGPTIGGYLTENWGWQYIFYVNLAPGALMMAILLFSLEPARMKLALLRDGDWPGVAVANRPVDNGNAMVGASVLRLGHPSFRQHGRP